jgi:hypothetical protein
MFLIGRLAVSSRGQDTWFSATGPGFDSPYRYHTRCNTGDCSEPSAVGSFPLKPVGSPLWGEPQRPSEHFSQQLAPVLDVPCQKLPPACETSARCGLKRFSIEPTGNTGFSRGQ